LKYFKKFMKFMKLANLKISSHISNYNITNGFSQTC